jgi:hypothetical protein
VIPAGQLGIPREYHDVINKFGYALCASIMLTYISFPIYCNLVGPQVGMYNRGPDDYWFRQSRRNSNETFQRMSPLFQTGIRWISCWIPDLLESCFCGNRREIYVEHSSTYMKVRSIPNVLLRGVSPAARMKLWIFWHATTSADVAGAVSHDFAMKYARLVLRFLATSKKS